MNDAKFLTDLYIRVSTDRQAKEGDSLEEQESELKKYCEFRQFEIRNIYIERGKSGGNTNRPEYQKLLEDVKAKKVNAVVVKKIDRLSRSLLDFEEFMLLLQTHNVEFISIKESFDTTSAMGKAMLRVALIFAQLEREQTSERLVDIFEFRASQGLYNGGIRPFGYTNVNKELVPYAKERTLVELMFDKFLETRSTTKTTRYLNEQGFRNRNNIVWDKRQIQKILQSPVYLGKVKWKNNLYQGLHAPIITEQRFEQVQNIFKKGYRIKGESITQSILQKLIFCGGCGSPLTPSHSLNKIKKKYYYYRCTSTLSAEKGKIKCGFKYVPFQVAETSVLTALLSLAEEKHFSSLENKILKHNQAIQENIELNKTKIQNISNTVNQLKTKKDKYLDSLLAGNFTTAERKIINKRLEEITLEEKQENAQLFKVQFELNQQRDEQIDLTCLKQTIVTFKADFETLSKSQLKEWLNHNLDKIIYSQDKLKLKFKILPWEIDC